ncbi:MAG: cytochrome c biogenesis protein ResB [Armatimonadota bacterium]
MTITQQESETLVLKPAETPRTWGWREAIFTQLTVVVLAMIVQLLFSLLGTLKNWHAPVLAMPAPPWNWVLTIVLIAVFIWLGAAFQRHAFIRWLSGPQFAITITILVALISLKGVFIVQDPAKTDLLARWGLRSIYTSLPFLAAIHLMLVNLAAVTGRRLTALQRPGSLAFLLNHIGLIMVIVAILAGSAQLRTGYVQLLEGMSATTAQSKDGKTDDPLGGTVKLNRFEVEFYPPQLVAIESGETMSQNHDFKHNAEWVAEGQQFNAYGMAITVEKYLPSGLPNKGKDWQAVQKGGVPAVKLHVVMPDGKTQEGWAYYYDYKGFLGVDDKHFVGLMYPKGQMPKAYRSYLTVTLPGQSPKDTVLEVNKPVKLGKWWLYQSSYQEGMMGMVSVIEAVSDPALPLVYIGLVCMILGSFLAFWFTPKRRQTTDEKEEVVAVQEEKVAE